MCNLSRYHSALLQTRCWENLKAKQIVYKVIVCECADCHLVEYYIVTYNDMLHHHSAHEKTSLAIKGEIRLKSCHLDHQPKLQSSHLAKSLLACSVYCEH